MNFRRLGVGVVGVALCVALSGCASTPSKSEACSGVDRAVTKLNTVFAHAEGASIAVIQDKAKGAMQYIDELRQVEGPKEFVELRDELADAFDGVLENAAGDGGGESAASKLAELAGPTVDMRTYCGWR